MPAIKSKRTLCASGLPYAATRRQHHHLTGVLQVEQQQQHVGVLQSGLTPPYRCRSFPSSPAPCFNDEHRDSHHHHAESCCASGKVAAAKSATMESAEPRVVPGSATIVSRSAAVMVKEPVTQSAMEVESAVIAVVPVPVVSAAPVPIPIVSAPVPVPVPEVGTMTQAIRDEVSTSAQVQQSDVLCQLFARFEDDMRNVLLQIGFPIQLEQDDQCSLVETETLVRYRLIEPLQLTEPTVTATATPTTIPTNGAPGTSAYGIHLGQELRMRIKNCSGQAPFHFCLLYQDVQGTFYSLFPVVSMQLKSVQEHFQTLLPDQQITLELPTAQLPRADQIKHFLHAAAANSVCMVRIMLLVTRSTEMKAIANALQAKLAKKQMASCNQDLFVKDFIFHVSLREEKTAEQILLSS